MSTTPAEVINNEIAACPDARVFRGRLITLCRQYQNTELAKSFMRFAIAANKGSAAEDVIQGGKDPHIGFFAGEILAMHAILLDQPDNQRGNFLDLNLVKSMFAYANTERERATVVHRLTDEIHHFQSQGWEEVYELQDPEHQEAIDNAAIRLRLTHMADPMEQGFTAGYLYAGNIISIIDGTVAQSPN
jgi:hypothetical protein